MENLNAEQIIENLERSIRLSMDFNSEFPVITYSKLRDALALINSQEQRIKELEQCWEHEHASAMEIFGQWSEKCERLTEENERLKTDLEIRNMKRASIFEIADAFDRGRIKGKADTVRKMQERLKADAVTIQDHTGKLGVVVGVGNIDDVAREMLEQEGKK